MSNPCRIALWFPAWHLLAAMAVAALGSGCSSGPQIHPLRGKVVFKGGKPLTGGSIAFESVAGDPPWRAGAEIGPDGTFTDVSTLGPKGEVLNGIVVGGHRVKIEFGRGGEDAPGIQVPARYLNFERSGITINVPAPGDEITIELDVK